MPPSELPEDSLKALRQAVEDLDLSPADLLEALSAVVSIKKQESKEKEGLKIYKDKTFLWEHTQDSWVFRHGKTKCGNFYLHIHCRDTGLRYEKSLRTPSLEQALVLGRKMYAETYGKLSRREKTKSLTTSELVQMYLDREEKRISPIPKTGITIETWKQKKQYLQVWERYVKTELKMEKTKIENIPPDSTRDFSYWVQRQEKNFYKETQWSSDYINSIISEVKRMYGQVAVREKFLSSVLTPQIDYLKKPPVNQVKRDILQPWELERLLDHLESTCDHLSILGIQESSYKGEPLMTEKQFRQAHPEYLKRVVFHCWITLAYQTGMRPKELLGLKWCDISINPADSKEHQKTNRLIQVRSENSKTGTMRIVNAPVADLMQRFKNDCKAEKIKCNQDDYIFLNPQRKYRVLHQKFFMDRLQKGLSDSGLKEELEKSGRHITLYSSRHFYATFRLQMGINIHLLAKQMGTSTTYIDQTYSHVEVSINTKTFNQGVNPRDAVTTAEEARQEYKETMVRLGLTEEQAHEKTESMMEHWISLYGK